MNLRPESEALFDRARQVLPGGVSSPVRAFKAVGGTPVVVRRAHGAYVEDVDGNTYLDFIGSWGPLILGHAPEEVVRAVGEAAADGTSYGAPCPAEITLAEQVVATYPGLEQVRFTSSGTEAVMSALRLARGATGRDAVLKFSGCYHGHVDSLLVAAGSGLITFGQPSSAGVPAALANLTHVLPLDDEAALRALFDAVGTTLAAVIVEPVPANNGLLLQRPAWLKTLRELCSRDGALLIFDEVISGFRVAPGGAAELYGITPDLATFGKIIGGGLPVGAFGGSRALMSHLAPLGPVYQAGTLSGNPLAMRAGLTTLRALRQGDPYGRLEHLGHHLEDLLTPVLAAAPFPARLVRQGSIFWMSLQEGEAPRSAEAIGAGGAAVYRRVFNALLDRGIMLAPSAYEVGFLSLAHTEAHLEHFARTLSGVLAELG